MAGLLPLIPSKDDAITLFQTRWKAILDPIIKGFSSSSSSSLPAGVFFAFAGSTAPTGFLLMQGQEVPVATYPALAAAVKTLWGTPVVNGNFKLPDGRGRTMIGAGTGTSLTNRILGTTGGEETHLQTVAEMPAHTHPIWSRTGTVTGTPAVVAGCDVSGTGAVLAGGPAAVNSTGGGTAFNVMPPWFAANWIIKT